MSQPFTCPFEHCQNPVAGSLPLVMTKTKTPLGKLFVCEVHGNLLIALLGPGS